MSSNTKKALPVLATFFVMGFCDVVGIATSYVKDSLQWTEQMAGFVPSMVFIWFLLLSVPIANVMNKIGRKPMVQVSNIVTIVGMLIPLIFPFNSVTCVVAFALLGIGNAILQVALNPLLSNVVSGETLTSSLTTGQVIKAVSSFCGPFIAAFAANSLGRWELMFPIYAAITLIASLWLQFTDIPKETVASEGSSVAATFGLLGDVRILLLFLGIFFVVGVDVGTNTVAPKLLQERAGYAVDKAGFGSSVYFVCRTVGALLGAVLLTKIAEVKYFIINIIAAIAALVALFFVQGPLAIMILVGAIGFFCSSIFSIIFGVAMKTRPDKGNEISGLMITGVVGGAVIPPLMAWLTGVIGNQNGSVLVIGLCMAYLLFCALYIGGREKAAKTA